MENRGVAGGAVVRRGRGEDRRFVEDLGKRTLQDSVAAFRVAHPAMLEASFDGLLDFVYREPHVAFIAERDEKPVGFLLMLTGMPDEVTRAPQGFIAYMAVEPAERKKGIAAALLSAAEDEARGLGLPYMGLMVTDDNAPARTLYDRAGYVTERRLLCKPL